jgi:hypothetical protein
VPVFDGDSEDVTARVQTQEHAIYPLVVSWFVDGRLAMRENKPGWMAFACQQGYAAEKRIFLCLRVTYRCAQHLSAGKTGLLSYLSVTVGHLMAKLAIIGCHSNERQHVYLHTRTQP